tara:strand:- start:567 stop:1004 length:438 start_codon:yes stop_codon:yes gene_type:complete
MSVFGFVTDDSERKVCEELWLKLESCRKNVIHPNGTLYDLVNVEKTQEQYQTDFDFLAEIKNLPNSLQRNILHVKLNDLHVDFRAGIIKQIKNERRIDREFGTPSYRRKKGIEVHDGIRGLDKITLAGKVYDIQKLRIDVLEGWE